MKRNKKAMIYFILLIIGAFVIMYYYADKREKELNANKAKVKGLITNMDIVIKGRGLYIKYVYEVKGRVIKDKRMVPVDHDHLKILANKIIGKEYPVIYDTLNESNNLMLLFKDEFEKYELNVPDSLRQIFYLLDSLRYDSKRGYY